VLADIESRRTMGKAARYGPPVTPASYGRALRRHAVSGAVAGRLQDQRAAPPGALRACPYSRATRGNIDITLTVDGSAAARETA
jgi:hypothetical protein